MLTRGDADSRLIYQTKSDGFVCQLDNDKIENLLEDFQGEVKQRHIDFGYATQEEAVS